MRPHSALIDLAAGRAIRVPSDVDALISSAIEHRMQGLLWSAVLAGELAPGPTARRRLAQEDARIRAWQRHLEGALGRLWRQLAEIDVETAVFKGVTTSARWYEREGERPCVDIDLLVSPSDIGRVGEIVRLLQPAHPLAGSAQELASAQHLPSFDLALTGGVFVDLHVDLLKMGVPWRSAARVWERTGTLRLRSGTIVRTIDPESALVQLLVSLSRDRFRYLLSYADVARLIRNDELDWAAVDEIVRAEGLEVPVYSALDAVTTTLGIPSTPHAQPRGWRAVVWRGLWRESIRLQGPHGRIRHRDRERWLPLLARGRMGEGLVAWGRYWFPPRSLLDYYFPHTRGSYLRRNALGRLGHLQRRRAKRRNA
jgi:hypothetical protein